MQVFAQGFQSRNVNSGNYKLAAGGSFFIGISQAAVWHGVMSADASIVEVLVYSAAGALAITSAMWTHRRFVKDKNG